MRTAVWLFLALGMFVIPWPASAQDQPPTEAAKELQALQSEMNKAMQEFMPKYQAATTDEEREKLFADVYPLPKFAPKYLAFAKKHPGTSEAMTALTMALQYANEDSVRDEAMELVKNDYMDSDALGTLITSWMYDPSKHDLIKRFYERSPHKEVKGVALYVLARLEMQQAGEDKEAQQVAQETFKKVIADFGDVPMRGRTLAEVAKADLFEATHLQIGMEAPEIVGADVGGAAFKLSDFRGKVVVLDFWGDW